MLNDPAIWGDPEVFRPERFLSPEASQLPNPLTLLFGFGLRYVLATSLESSESPDPL
jgi:cytochrome P450